MQISGKADGGAQLRANEQNIATAMRQILSAAADDIVVKFDTTDATKHRYTMTFQGALAGQNIGNIFARSHLSTGKVLPYNVVQGGAGTGSKQQVKVTSEATGKFTLSLTHAGNTYTTTDLPFDASPGDVQTALNAALSSLAGATVTVGGEANNWDVTFEGSLAGVTVPLMTIIAVADVDAPSGSFVITHDGLTTDPIVFADDDATQAANILSALEGLTNIDSGNVSVALDASRSGDDYRSFRVDFIGALANQDIADFSTNSSQLNLATAKPSRQNNGATPRGETQRVVLSKPRSPVHLPGWQEPSSRSRSGTANSWTFRSAGPWLAWMSRR